MDIVHEVKVEKLNHCLAKSTYDGSSLFPFLGGQNTYHFMMEILYYRVDGDDVGQM